MAFLLTLDVYEYLKSEFKFVVFELLKKIEVHFFHYCLLRLC